MRPILILHTLKNQTTYTKQNISIFDFLLQKLFYDTYSETIYNRHYINFHDNYFTPIFYFETITTILFIVRLLALTLTFYAHTHPPFYFLYFVTI